MRQDPFMNLGRSMVGMWPDEREQLFHGTAIVIVIQSIVHKTGRRQINRDLIWQDLSLRKNPGLNGARLSNERHTAPFTSRDI